MQQIREILISGLSDLGLSCDSEKVEALLTFLALLEKWNKIYNLTAISTAEEAVALHLLDSLAVLPWLHGQRMIDVGTGAGLPGVPLAIFAKDSEFVLLDGNAKKTRFVQQAAIELKLGNVNVCRSRVEDYDPDLRFDTLITRAFSSLQTVLEEGGHLLAEGGVILAMKGQEPLQELAQITLPYTIHQLDVPGVNGKRCLIKVEKNYG